MSTQTKKKRRKLTKEDKLLAQRIRQLRLEQNLTQEDLAGRLGVNGSYIAYIETGRRGLSLPSLYKIAKIFGIPVKDLFTF